MLVHYSWKANPHGRGDRAGSRGRRGRAGVGREVRRVSSPPLLRLRRLRGRLTTQGSRRGPVNERVRTRTDSVACERKPAGHRPTEATPQVSEAGPPTFFAKVGVAGSNPVVRSKNRSADQPLLVGHRSDIVAPAHELPMACP
jgi:hypothetical protein